MAALANRQLQIDALTFTEWVDAYSAGKTKLAAFYFDRFRPEFRPAVTAWVATKPLKNPKAPLTPFAMPEYRSAALAEADRLEAKGGAESVVAAAYVARADRYTLSVVLFAMSLFFAGIYKHSPPHGGLACRLSSASVGPTFLGAIVWMATFPVSL